MTDESRIDGWLDGWICGGASVRSGRPGLGLQSGEKNMRLFGLISLIFAISLGIWEGNVEAERRHRYRMQNEEWPPFYGWLELGRNVACVGDAYRLV